MRCKYLFGFLFVFLSLFLFSQEISNPYLPKPYVEINAPQWTKNATLYELNTRQFSKEGDFKAIEKALPRLKSMGIDIIWLMPIHPIGKENRKGILGSYYAVQDYYGVNPEFGTEEDFRSLVKAIHKRGMHVIIDWVANHSSWDNPLRTSNPNWYIKSRDGKFQSTPWRDYDDIIDFDYNNPELREYMTKAMRYWVKEFDIDGFRCDVASFVPIDFWENVRKELEEIKPVFMLAEAMDKELHRKAFDATYAWELYDTLHEITRGKKSIKALTEGYIAEHVSIFPKEGTRINFTDNHDKNSWEGNQYLNFGKGLKAAMVLSTTLDGMPLVYNGQEAGLNRSLSFFEKDPIEWKKHENEDIYRSLFSLKHRNKALWNGKHGGELVRINNDQMDYVISFVREKENHKVITVVNLSDQPIKVTLDTKLDQGTYNELFTNKTLRVLPSHSIELDPWGYSVLYTNP